MVHAMAGVFDHWPDSGRVLLTTAAPKEALALLHGFDADPKLADHPWRLHPLGDRFDLLITGVGKANAAACVARHFDTARHAIVLNLGVAGALRGTGLRLGQVVLATESVLGDEGVAVPDGFESLVDMGFPPGPGRGERGRRAMAAPIDVELRKRLRKFADREGPIATVSECSGTDARAAAIFERTDALCEAMEGAAIGMCCRWIGATEGADQAPRFGEMRIVSNTTGDRGRQQWDLRKAFEGLEALAGQL